MKAIDDLIERLASLGRRQLDQLTKHCDVATSAKVRSSAPQQDGTSLAVLGGVSRGAREFVYQLAIGGVQHFGAVQDDFKNGVISLQNDTWHRSLLALSGL
jgi:hypothetical protein